jgi:hypothetical protein
LDLGWREARLAQNFLTVLADSRRLAGQLGSFPSIAELQG